MLKTNPQTAISEVFPDAVGTRAQDMSLVPRDRAELAANRAAWHRIMDQQLIEWGRDPSQLTDDGVDAPTEATISRAFDLARKCRDVGFPPPTAVFRDSNGGIVFERRDGEYTSVVHFWDDGTGESMMFRGTELIQRLLM